MIDGLGQVALTVRDVERSVAFYRDAVGLRFLFAPAPTLAFLWIGDVRLMLSTAEGEFSPGGSTVLYLRVADIDAEHAAMSERGSRSSTRHTWWRGCRTTSCGCASSAIPTTTCSR